MAIPVVLAERQTKQPLYKRVSHGRPYSVRDTSPDCEPVFQATDVGLIH
jgi:hypothetical protein